MCNLVVDTVTTGLQTVTVTCRSATRRAALRCAASGQVSDTESDGTWLNAPATRHDTIQQYWHCCSNQMICPFDTLSSPFVSVSQFSDAKFVDILLACTSGSKRRY
jgi:hypothetical protein